MAGFRSAGVSGYVGKKRMKMRHRRKRGFKKRRKFVKRVERIVQKTNMAESVNYVLNTFQATQAVNTCGKQDLKAVGIMNSGGDVVAIKTSIGSVGSYTVNSNNSSFFVNTYILQICMKNQEQTNAIVDLYELVPRVASLIAPATNIHNLVLQTNGSSAGVIDDTTWGWTPFQCSAVCQNYKVLGKTRYLLAPGACEIVEIREKKTRRIRLSDWYGINNTTPATQMVLPRVSKIWLAITRGEPTNDHTTPTAISTSSYKVDFVCREDYHYSFDPNDLAPILNQTANNFGSIVGEQTLAEEQGTVLNPPAQA